MTVPRGTATWLMRYLPEPIAANPERVLINLGCALIGLSTIVGQRAPALDRLWPFPLYEWAMAMLIGGFAVLIGIFRRKRSLERLGMLLVLIGCLFYAGLLVIEFGWHGALTAIIFLAIAAAKAVRLITTSAVRASNIQLGEEMNEAPPLPDGGM